MPKFPQYLQIPPVRGVPAQSELKVGHCNNSPVVSGLFRDHVLPYLLLQSMEGGVHTLPMEQGNTGHG
ncbi:hypothetical protein CEXT_100621 [Caerostris extrusa]|uniref:Uncharacterized protein n=1 Tax=Caerostris extrusa TaxID=172846 RepID=A0AAV4RK76_CAEEX|nr:hypothetical protein CEXT_100621 [Caerostris extrusa]